MKIKKYSILLFIIYFGCENNPIVSTDCNGIENGISIEDNCGICDDDPINDCIQDCSGIWGGTAIYDECGICGGNGKLDCNNVCIQPDENGNYLGEGVDCFGICGGNAEIDECLVCNGPGSVYFCGCSGIEEGKCDCEGNIFGCDNVCGSGLIEDCSGECDGNLIIDECGECDGPGPENNYDCDGNCISDFDECGICGGDNSSCSSIDFDACSMPINHLHMIEGSVFYNVNFDIGGFQFDIDGTTVSGYSGGDALVNGFTISVGGNTVLGFSFTGGVIPQGCGLLTELTLSDIDAAEGLSSITCAVGSSGTESLTLEYYTGP